MREKVFRRKMRRARMKNKDIQQRAELQKALGTAPGRTETSKKLAIYLFVLMNAIVLYALIAMWHFGDLSYLGVLITDIAGQVMVYAIYCVKAYMGKKAEEDVKLARDQMETEMTSEPITEDVAPEKRTFGYSYRSQENE